MESTSGMSELPTLLPHPGFLEWNKHSGLFTNMFCYIQKYDDPGISLLINKNDGEISVQVGDWLGNVIDIKEASGELAEFLKSDLVYYINLVSAVKLNLAQFYFTKNYNILDVQVSLNKFAGPGMIKDVFCNKLPSLEIIDIAILNDEKISEITDGLGTYSDSLIIRPSKFRLVELEGIEVPLYSRVR